ncbi:hypothetical protein Tsubulata_048258 [Turnera subulata]|uniref:type I protein arginine methyltransferase n=1 Tax=Turnera subulata TaxID=218843 RepID=A0A9Q0JFU7_9ROSI|nr:hypothetical protein Tsubulata_048258 [Turnera subulata]
MAGTHKAEKAVMEPESELEELEEEEEEENGGWDDWREEEGEDGEEDSSSDLLCLFCDTKYASSPELFDHCLSVHKFDFHGVKTSFNLDFYGCFKLINYIRSQVAEDKSWSFEHACNSGQKDSKMLWDDDKYLKPFLSDDPLLYSFGEDEEGDDGDDYSALVEKEDVLMDLENIEGIGFDEDNVGQNHASTSSKLGENGTKEVPSTSNGTVASQVVEPPNGKLADKDMKGSTLMLPRKEIKKANENYFGAYSSFGIHREMISDKVRMDAYRQAILQNPSLLTGAVVMDVGCGTGILSLFSAQAGASRVIAVEASQKMAAVATQIAKDNGLLRVNAQTNKGNECGGIIEVVQSMVEDIDKSVKIEPHSIDVLLSEWMGYCLLYESMLSSVLFARDKWLKPGGAMLPDTATIYAAGFGRGATSLPFWEDVYGFSMSCVGNELVQDSAKIPIVDVVNENDLVTNSAVLQTFDLVTMKHDEVDFTASIELEPKPGSPPHNSTDVASKTTWCYGVVLWFDTGFTTRFCKEAPAVLSTSPYTPKTHWSQTILTFQEPIAVAFGRDSADGSAAVGTDACPAARLCQRISIARASQHRSIDISLETVAISHDGRKRCWPVQIFNLS